ncbi:hypothetical protein NFI96_021153 [Prochilodus magdalenae]|nr:hypothetical protein NFI96_021153 [Prochilodus magdalenae]
MAEVPKHPPVRPRAGLENCAERKADLSFIQESESVSLHSFTFGLTRCLLRLSPRTCEHTLPQSTEPACVHLGDPMEEKTGRHMRLREWLIAQIDSGRYAGLSWENQEKTMFKIPWKHAAKQDYKQNEDAALFRAWAVYKGKYREGRDKADPSAWKTRLRCALNKSTDFQEVPERSQLDISEPYKVYRILEDTEKPPDQLVGSVKVQMSQMGRALREPAAVQTGIKSESRNNGVSNERHLEGRLDLHCSNITAGIENSAPAFFSLLPPQGSISDFRLQVCLFYHGQLVQKLISASPEGCFILQGSAPVGSERIYGPCAAQKVFFPRLDVLSFAPGIMEAMSRLLPHLEKGVLVWVAPDGVFIKRFCQGRVYWDGPLAEHREKPNKLERERTCKLMDMQIFLQELHRHLHGGGPKPRYEIDLCFGEEFPDSSQPKSRKLITAQVGPHKSKRQSTTILQTTRSRNEQECSGTPFQESTLVRSDTDVGREGLALSLHSNPSQRCSIGWRSGLCAGQSSSSTPDSLIRVFMELALCTGVRSCWNRKGPSPNCPHKVGSMEWSRVSWSAEALRVPLTGTKGRSPTPEHHPHTIIPPPPNSTLGTVQSDKYRSPGTAKPRLVHRITRRRSVIGHSREHASTALESRGGALHHCVPRSALRLVM